MTEESTYDARPVYDDDEPTSVEGAMPVAERMQSLLSRAVEEQVSEQRHLADALDAIRRELAVLRDHLTLRDPLAEIREDIDEVRDRVDTTAGRVMELTQRLEAVHNAVDRLVQQRTERSPELDRLEEINARLADLPEPDFEPLHDRLVELAKRVDALSAPDLGSLHERLARLEARLSDIDVPDLEPIHERLARLDEFVGGLSGQSLPADELLQAERRIAGHIDEAVLALAEALLRPRAPSGTQPAVADLDLPLPQLSAPPGPPEPPPSRVMDEPAEEPPAIRVDEHAEPRRRPWWRPGG